MHDYDRKTKVARFLCQSAVVFPTVWYLSAQGFDLFTIIVTGTCFGVMALVGFDQWMNRHKPRH